MEHLITGDSVDAMDLFKWADLKWENVSSINNSDIKNKMFCTETQFLAAIEAHGKCLWGHANDFKDDI